jgi:hypothetical protein
MEVAACSGKLKNSLENLTVLVSGTELVQFLALPTKDAESLVLSRLC